MVVSGPIASSVSYQTYQDQGYTTTEIDTYQPSYNQDQNIPEVEIEVKPVETWDAEEDIEEIEVLYFSSYDVVRGWRVTAKITDLVLAIAPGISVEAL